MSRQLTIRGVPDDIADRLERLSRAQGRSMNATVNELLERSLGQDARRRELEAMATWTAADLTEFDSELAAIRTVDDELWR